MSLTSFSHFPCTISHILCSFVPPGYYDVCRLRQQFQLTTRTDGYHPGCHKIQRDIYLHDCFVVRYDAKRQRYLPPHYDESTISFIIPLNDDFSGGGTYIHSLRRVVAPPIGGMVTFCGGELLHGGDPIIEGVRYILAAFCYVDLIESDNETAIKKFFPNDTNNALYKAKQSSDKEAFTFGFDI